MTLVSDIIEMQKQGLGETEIIQKLVEQGYTPLDINSALEQSKIKAAVAEDSSNLPVKGISGMQPSVMEQEQFQEYLQPNEASQQYQQPEYSAQQQYQEQPQQEYQEQTQQYPEYQYTQYQSTSVENYTEIAESLIDEKIGEIRKIVSEVQNFKLIAEGKIKNIDERLKKIENYMQEIQSKLLSKNSEFNSSIQDIRTELKMIQESFSKILNPTIDKTRNETIKDTKKKKA